MQDRGTSTGRGDLAASQILGFILMFAMTFVILTVAIVVVSERVRQGEQTARRSLLAESAAAVADAIREAVAFADLHPDAGFVRRVDLPTELAGAAHTITVTNTTVRAGTPSGDPVRAGGYDLTASGIGFRTTHVHAPTVGVVYERCDPGETTGPCEPGRRQGRRNLVLREGAT